LRGRYGLNEASTLVIDLLTYIEEVEKLKTQSAFAVLTEFFVAYQQDLKGLPWRIGFTHQA